MRLGLLSTARINDEIIAGAAESDRVAIVAVASRDGGRARAYAAEHGIPRAHPSYEDILDDSDVDAVYISLPNGLHHEWTMRALAAGKHVLCEKPYSRHPAEVEEAFDDAGRRGLVLMEAFMYRHHPQTRELERLVAEGAVGSLLAVKSTFTFPLASLTDVRARPELAGGALMDVGCYCVNSARLFVGEPLSVYAEQVIGPSGVDMELFGTMRFAGDVVGQFEASFVAPKRQALELVGNDGVLVASAPFRIDWPGDVRLLRDGAERILTLPEANSYRVELENIADAVAGLSPPLLDRDDALGQARAIDALYRSAEEGAVTLV